MTVDLVVPNNRPLTSGSMNPSQSALTLILSYLFVHYRPRKLRRPAGRRFTINEGRLAGGRQETIVLPTS